MSTLQRQHPATPRRQRGINLVELMISMAIGLFLLAGLVGIFVNSSQTSAELSKSAQQLENGRFAVQALSEDIAHTGFFGAWGFSGTPAAVTDPCATSVAALKTGTEVPLFGAAGGAALWPLSVANTCAALTAANRKADTAVLVVRRAETKTASAGTYVVGETYVQSNSNPDNVSNPLVALATDTNGPATLFPLKLKDNATQAPVRRLRTHIYFVSPCSKPLVCTGASTEDSIPTLKRLELSAGSFTVVPIAEGIENLQFEYGVDADSDGAPESPFVAAPASAAAWANVVAVQVFLLARNADKSGGHTDTKRYYLGAATTVGPMNDAYKRHAYSALVRVVNTSQRREIP